MGNLSELEMDKGDLERFFSRFVVDPDTGCWEWSGSKLKPGYGRFWLNGKTRLAHRVHFHHVVGIKRNESEICHTCHNPGCIRIAHLYEGDAKTNSDDKMEAGRCFNSNKTHCPLGHPYDGSNTIVRVNGGRECRKCDLERVSKYYKTKKTEIRKGSRDRYKENVGGIRDRILAKRKKYREENAEKVKEQKRRSYLNKKLEKQNLEV